MKFSKNEIIMNICYKVAQILYSKKNDSSGKIVLSSLSRVTVDYMSEKVSRVVIIVWDFPPWQPRENRVWLLSGISRLVICFDCLCYITISLRCMSFSIIICMPGYA